MQSAGVGSPDSYLVGGQAHGAFPASAPPSAFPYQTNPAAPGNRGRTLLVVGAAVVAVVLVAGGVAAAVLLRDDGGEGGEPVAQSNPNAQTCSYVPVDGENRKDVGMPPSKVPAAQPTRATIQTNLGTLVVQLDAANAPCTVNSLAYLAGKGLYNDTSCHRVTTDASLKVLQCGDPTGTGMGGPAYRFPDENLVNVRYTRGTVAMANSGPDTNGSQFFILYADTTSLPPDYTPFGRVTSGMDIVDQVAKEGAETGTDGRPKKDITITQFRTA